MGTGPRGGTRRLDSSAYRSPYGYERGRVANSRPTRGMGARECRTSSVGFATPTGRHVFSHSVTGYMREACHGTRLRSEWLWRYDTVSIAEVNGNAG